MNLFQYGRLTLKSKRTSDFKLECDALVGEDIKCLAFLIHRLVGPFTTVEGVPRGGLKLATAMRTYAGDIPGIERHLIVDDVLTTGGSMEDLRRVRKNDWPWRPAGTVAPEIIGAVVFARGPVPEWIKAVFPMPEELWQV